MGPQVLNPPVAEGEEWWLDAAVARPPPLPPPLPQTHQPKKLAAAPAAAAAETALTESPAPGLLVMLQPLGSAPLAPEQVTWPPKSPASLRMPACLFHMK